MRNLKKFLALVLATMMLLSVAVISTSAADDADYTEAANFLAALDIMKGNENGDLMLDNGVTRYQAALFFVQALTGKTDVAYWNADKKSAHFSDVPEYGTAIDHAYGINLIKGRGNGVYGYNDPILYQDMLVMAVRALGYETSDMSYPYGYILAAQKLGLTDDVAQINYKAALTRGETAQIIADMLQTKVAVVDPLTDKILYPTDTGLTDAITKVETERKTLLEDSGLAGGKVTATIDAYVEADEDDEEDVDTLVITITDAKEEIATVGDSFEIAAADLSITAETPWIAYMGLSVDIYVKLAEKALFSEADYEDEDATIVLATFPTYTTVTNLGDAGDIRFVENTTNPNKSYISLGGTKFTEEKYSGEVYTFDGTWEKMSGADARELVATFAYEDGEYTATTGNTYAQVSYRVTDRLYDADGVEESGDEKTIVEILYTPFYFGQYNVRELNGNKYTVVGVYDSSVADSQGKPTYINLAEEKSFFVEYLVDKIGTSSAKVTSATKTISNTKGEKALNVTVEGEAVEAGDFMFYNYNAVDNILTVVANCGTFQTGRLTAQTAKTKTVKISGTSYEVGFKGLFSAGFASEFNSNTNKTFIAALEAGKDNVKYIVVDGNVVYMEACSEVTNDSKFDFAITTLDPEVMMDLLEITSEAKYEAALTAGLYVEDGAVKVAMMNKTTGAWELVSVDTFSAQWVAEDEEFAYEFDLATEAKYTDLIGEDYKNADAVAAFGLLASSGLMAVVEENNGVYSLALPEEGFFVFGTTEEGLLFSDNSNKTNAITADDEIDPARVTIDEETVIIVLGNGVGSRVGVQKAENSFPVTEGVFLAASSDLIVLVDNSEEAINVADWADAATANSDENWFITTLTTGVEVEAGETEDDPYVVTITNVYDMKAEEIVESVKVEVEGLAGADALDVEGPGKVLFQNARGEVVVIADEDVDFDEIIVEVANDNEDKLEYASAEVFEFINDDTIVIDDVTNTVDAYDVNVKVITLDHTNLDPEEYDLAGVVSGRDFVFTVGEEGDDDYVAGDENNEYGIGDVEITVGEGSEFKWEYFLDTELVNEITEPTEGVYDQYITNSGADFILVPQVDNDDYADAACVAVEFYVAYAIEDGVANVVVYKVLWPAA